MSAAEIIGTAQLAILSMLLLRCVRIEELLRQCLVDIERHDRMLNRVFVHLGMNNGASKLDGENGTTGQRSG